MKHCDFNTTGSAYPWEHEALATSQPTGTDIHRGTARGTIPTMGIRHPPLRARQWCITISWSEDSDAAQQDQRKERYSNMLTSLTKSRATSAIGASYNGGAHQWTLATLGERESTTIQSTKDNKGKGKYRSRGHCKGFDKANRGRYNKGGYNNGEGKRMTQRLRTKGTTANQNERKQQLHDMAPMWQAWPLGTRL